MLLAIDVGNTRIKSAVFENDIILEQSVFLKNELEKKIKNILKNFPKVTNLVVASVGNLEKDVFLKLDKNLKVDFITL